MGRAIKNYTTEIDAVRTAGELSSLLAQKGARAIQIEYLADSGGIPESLAFALDINGQRLMYKLPARAEGVLATLKRDRVEARYCNIAQARRIAWRILVDWVKAQIAIVDMGSADLQEVFLPYMIVASGETVYQRFLSTGLALPAGGKA